MNNFMVPSETLEKIASPEAGTLAFLSDAAQISSAIRASGLFDRTLYLDSNPDVKAAGIDPVDHYVNYGCREGRNPNSWFDTIFYLNDNPDIAGKLANPFLHYIYAGYREGRRPNPAIQRGRSRLIVANRMKNKLQFITEYLEYLKVLIEHKDQLLILISIKDSLPPAIQPEIMWLMFKLGINTDLNGKYRQSYLAVIDSGILAHEECSLNHKLLKYQFSSRGSSFTIISASFNDGNKSVLSHNDIDYSPNQRGFNFLVMDALNMTYLDAVCFDPFYPYNKHTRSIQGLYGYLH